MAPAWKAWVTAAILHRAVETGRTSVRFEALPSAFRFHRTPASLEASLEMDCCESVLTVIHLRKQRLPISPDEAARNG